MANKQLVEDYEKYFEKEVGKAYGLDKTETDVLRGVYEKIAKKTADEIREHIKDLKSAYDEYKEENDLDDEEIRRAMNVELRRFLIARRRKAIRRFASACRAAVEKYDLTPEECEVVKKYWMARFSEMMGDMRERFSEVSENFGDLIERYDLEEEDLINMVSAVAAAYILL